MQKKIYWNKRDPTDTYYAIIVSSSLNCVIDFEKIIVDYLTNINKY